ncbi:putative proteophosphoglycan ppg3 [Leishmania braziliensis MHOM/BR/75/M2904]|uniref:Proteophosphoglycan ppg3 n=1 Tax=Leishmania braziliensis TaxID=5660 RepID=A4HM88_LEIBR|nr:putative proteophosphoglycan ppg3 [Leishmania braziliensis MHOM/BR/75/M2904]CAM43272.1 putative proteophosphoglycan ppg3 [Leishmania braziliensis MHOM/BR/75/M2904]
MTYPQLAAQVARRSLQRQWQPEISVWVLLAFTVLALFVSVATASPPLLNTQSPAVLQKEEELLDCTEHEAIPFYTAEQQANTLAFLAEFPYAIPALSNTWMCHNFCKWNGVHCSEEGVEVSLHSRRLIGRLPEVPAAVDPDHIMVTSIVLKGRGDGIESTLPESWLHLTKLTTLQLNLENKPPVSTSLKIQNVAYKMQPMNTAASSVNTKACFLPRNVVNVSITRNSISGRLPPRFPLCNPKMQYLYLQYNPDIYGPIPKEWGKWTSLQILNIKGTRVCGCAPPEWGNFNPPVTLLAEDLVTHPEICNTSCPDISTSSSSAPSSSSSSAPSSSSSALECDGPIPFYSESQQVNTRSFLEAFKDTIEDLQPLWTCTNFCVWPYVLCTPAGVAVEITGTEFFGHVPEVSPDVDTAEVVVTKLDFSHSMWVEGDYPASWASLHSLEHVSFAYTAMSGTLPSEWGDMDALRYLDLSFTWTNGMFPQSWSRLAKLEVLNLMHLTIPDHPPDSWSHMTALRELNLASTRASGTLPASWSSLKNLEILSLSNNTMFGSLPEQWGSLKQLATLMLHENYLSGSIPEIYNDMTALTRASLENNRFCGCLPSVWAAQQGVSMTITAQKEVLASDCATANTCDPEAVSSSSSAPSSSSSSAPSSSSSAPSSSSSSAPSSSSSAPSSSSSSAPSSSSSAPSSSSSSAPSSSSSAPSSSSSAPSSSSSAPTTTEEPTPDPVLPSSASSSVDRTFYDALYFYCPNVEEAGVETIQAHKEEICCNAWDGADYSVTCGDEIRGFSNAIVTCSGAIGSRGYFSCCSRVGRDGTATFLGERCEDKPVDGVDSHEALAPWWNPRTSGGGLLLTLLAVIVVCVL